MRDVWRPELSLDDALGGMFPGRSAGDVSCSYGTSSFRSHGGCGVLLAAGLERVCLFVAYKSARKMNFYAVQNRSLRRIELHCEEISPLHMAELMDIYGLSEQAERLRKMAEELYGERVGSMTLENYGETKYDVYVLKNAKGVRSKIFLYLPDNSRLFEEMEEALRYRTVKSADVPEWVIALVGRLRLSGAL